MDRASSGSGQALEPEFVAELPLALVILMRGPMRLVEARVAAHKQAVYVLPARVACKEELAHRNAGDVLSSSKHLRNPVERLEMLHPQLFGVQTMPIPRTAHLRASRPIELQSSFITAERNLRSVDSSLRAARSAVLNASVSSHNATSVCKENPPWPWTTIGCWLTARRSRRSPYKATWRRLRTTSGAASGQKTLPRAFHLLQETGLDGGPATDESSRAFFACRRRA